MPYKDPETRNARAREKYKENREARCAYMREYRIRRKDSIKKRYKEGIYDSYYREYNRSSLSAKLQSYKGRCRLRKIDFSLEKEKFEELLKKACVYCGDTPEIYGGIDRVDNNKGYVEGNVVSCCVRCNMMKSSQEKDNFIAHCQKIVNNIKNISEKEN